ncbi:hypothetical protein Q0N28_14690, partial [Staphylococcus aureus]|nr:hypothetical protein [Staphylococcus aureus]
SEDTASAVRVLDFPPLPEVPEIVRGRSLAVIEIAHQGTQAEGDEIAAPLRALGADIDTLGMVPAPALSHLHMDPPEPVPYRGDGM